MRRQSAAITTAPPTRGRVSVRAELVTPYIGLMTQRLARDSPLMRGQENHRAKERNQLRQEARADLGPEAVTITSLCADRPSG